MKMTSLSEAWMEQECHSTETCSVFDLQVFV